jgi:hypothetical protein
MSQYAKKDRVPRKVPSPEPLPSEDQIIIDDAKGLVFSSEEELYHFFLPQIQAFEKEYFTNRTADDIQDDELADYEDLLPQVLDAPDEIWQDIESVQGYGIHNYISHFNADGVLVHYVAVAYRTAETPSFVFLHFASRDQNLVSRFRRGEMIYDRVVKEVENGAVEGDALSEGDDLAVGLYKSMLTVRSDKDIKESEFKSFENLRETTIEEADEIWRTDDFSGHVLVSFIKDFSEDADKEVFYIVVTMEDATSSSHSLLFSFPTKDRNLVDRYRHGENLQAEEVVQEASH